MTVTMVTLLSLIGIALIWTVLAGIAMGLRLLWLMVGDWWHSERGREI